MTTFCFYQGWINRKTVFFHLFNCDKKHLLWILMLYFFSSFVFLNPYGFIIIITGSFCEYTVRVWVVSLKKSNELYPFWYRTDRQQEVFIFFSCQSNQMTNTKLYHFDVLHMKWFVIPFIECDKNVPATISSKKP